MVVVKWQGAWSVCSGRADVVTSAEQVRETQGEGQGAICLGIKLVFMKAELARERPRLV